ncbi:hypothetical protein PT2222_40183 [Paraburkholderia tropica]
MHFVAASCAPLQSSIVERIALASALPADRELRLQRLAALRAAPRPRARRRPAGGVGDQLAGERFVALVDEPDLRRALFGGNLAHRAAQIAVVQLARHAGRREDVHPVLGDHHVGRANELEHGCRAAFSARSG